MITASISEEAPLLCVLGACGVPASVVGLHLLIKHKERMRLLDDERARSDGLVAQERDALLRRLQALEAILGAGASGHPLSRPVAAGALPGSPSPALSSLAPAMDMPPQGGRSR